MPGVENNHTEKIDISQGLRGVVLLYLRAEITGCRMNLTLNQLTVS